MINIDDILKLKEAGFTAEEIVNLHQAMEPYEEPVPAEPVPAEPVNDSNNEVLDAIKTLTKSIQAMNIVKTGAGANPDPAPTVEDILNFAINGGK